jgi:putative PIN family toxin of toxin-antitoxin system
VTRLVLDTNLVVSGVLTPRRPCAALLASVLNDQATLFLDARIFDEYRNLLARPKFKLPQGAVTALLQGLHDLSTWVLPAPLPSDLLPDPDDLAFLELALAADAILVTGNLRHFPSELRRGAEVMEPMEALKRATRQGPRATLAPCSRKKNASNPRRREQGRTSCCRGRSMAPSLSSGKRLSALRASCPSAADCRRRTSR